MTAPLPHRERLGAGGVLADTLAAFFGRFGLMFALAFAPAVLGLLMDAAASAALPAMVANLERETLIGLTTVISIIRTLFDVSLSNGLVVIAAFDAKVGRPIRFGLYVRRALANLVTVGVMSIVSILLVVAPILATLALVAGSRDPALASLILVDVLVAFYLWSAFSPLVPAIVIEGAGFAALGRAWRLTSGYRWSVGGTMILIYFVSGLIDSVGDVAGKAAAAIDGTWLPFILSVATGAISGGFGAAGMAMIYARLRGIKEGLDIESLADVFS